MIQYNKTDFDIEYGLNYDTWEYGYTLTKYKGSNNNVVIPEGVTTIGIGAFREDFWKSNCPNIISVTIPSTVTRIENDAFLRCTKLKSITLPSQLNYIGNSAFSCCKSLQYITIPYNIKKLETSTFYMCESLKSIFFMNDEIDIVTANSIFAKCTSLKYIHFKYSHNDTNVIQCAMREARVRVATGMTISDKLLSAKYDNTINGVTYILE